jgi:23S rRNA (adenine2503-C2)-methyltransferase
MAEQRECAGIPAPLELNVLDDGAAGGENSSLVGGGPRRAEKRRAPGSAPGPVTLMGRDRVELEALVRELGEPAYRGRQIAQWVYRKSAHRIEEMTDLPVEFRARLAEKATVGRSALVTSQTSRDGTAKLLLEETDGRRIETVLLPYEARTSVCISSQVGCPVGCVFCATATMGFTRNVTAGEMVDQVLAAQEAAQQAGRPRITHVVVMGMGEPLLNMDELLKAIRLLNREVGIAMRHITVSTAGYVPGIRRLAEENLQITLALSLHAPNDTLRAQLIPLATKYPLKETMAAVRGYTEQTGRRVTLEYLLLSGVNDTEPLALELAHLVRGMITHVNLIPWNPAETFSAFQAPSAGRVRAFRRALERHGLTVTQRVERGQDISAACGQLAVKDRNQRDGVQSDQQPKDQHGDTETRRSD